jgi:hypothetical protein
MLDRGVNGVIEVITEMGTLVVVPDRGFAEFGASLGVFTLGEGHL